MEIDDIINQAEKILRQGSGISEFTLVYKRMLKQLKICAKIIKEIDEVVN